jgi:glyoxylase-like metal-dependent hydrolase (beta-lactamase superfamily II)
MLLHGRILGLGLARAARSPDRLASAAVPRQIDVHHEGIPQVICCYAVEDAIVDPGPASTIDTLLEALGDEPPARILLTHIHLDHAGAAGTLVRRWPGVEVWVHERGARHLIDPSKLVRSATRIYGDDMDRLWGEIAPVPERNLRVLGGGERIGPWRVEYTPGHAWHHVSYLHEPTGSALVGDVCGVRIAGGPILPPTPPPDVDLEAWRASLDLVEGWQPERIGVTHFGLWDDVPAHVAAMRRALDEWGELARRVTDEEYASATAAEMPGEPGSALNRAYRRAMPPDMLWAGWDRYWSARSAT